MKIGIAGVGGIGSNVARLLVQAGIKKLKIVDFDRVEISNMNRQFFRIDQAGEKKIDALEKNLKAISKGLSVEKHALKIRPGDAKALFEDCSVIVEGFDQKHLKKMLIEELAETGTRIVSASGIAGRNMDAIKVRKLGQVHIVGDLVSDQADHILFPPKIAMVAAMMAGIVLNQIEEI